MNFSIEKKKHFGFIKCDICGKKKFAFSHWCFSNPIIFSIEHKGKSISKHVDYVFCNKCVDNCYDFMKMFRKENIPAINMCVENFTTKRNGSTFSLVEEKTDCVLEHISICGEENLCKMLLFAIGSMQNYMLWDNFSNIEMKSIASMGELAKNIFQSNDFGGYCFNGRPVVNSKGRK